MEFLLFHGHYMKLSDTVVDGGELLGNWIFTPTRKVQRHQPMKPIEKLKERRAS